MTTASDARAESSIHPTAIVGDEVTMGPGCSIGPGCVLTGRITLAANVRLIAGVTIDGTVTVGENTLLYPGVCIGFPPQDFKFKPGAPTAGVVIGRDCHLREHVTVHAASKLDAPTTIGDRCYMMVGSHAGHDVRIGNDVTLVNGTLLAGHVQIGDKVTTGGGAMIHQFCRIGRMAFLSGGTEMAMNTPPFCLAANRNQLLGLNIVGLRRSGMDRAEITLLRKAFRKAFRTAMPRAEMVAVLDEFGKDSAAVREMADFVRTSNRPVAIARTATDHDEDEA